MEVVAQNLTNPWEVAFLPDRDLLVTERSGTLRRIGKNGQVFTVEGVEHIGEGGLLGMALHPRFSENNLLYLYLTTKSGEGLTNRVDRYYYANDQLTDKKTIISDIPGAVIHDGGRIAFGPDGFLYITTGDAGNAAAAQEKNSLAGKILRLKDDGNVPADNPFGSAIYSWGHRNPQGLAWDSSGQLWATEHGSSGHDELNLIKSGANYGWPEIQGDGERAGMERPAAHSGSDTWAPSGLAYLGGSLFFGGLRGESVFQTKITGTRLSTPVAYYRGEFGRIRAVAVGPDGYFYVTTSNSGSAPRALDDKIIKIKISTFGN